MTDATDHVQVVDNSAEQRFEAQIAGAVAGFVDYHRRGCKVSLTHTEVDAGFEGQGIGSTLARQALDAVRDGGLSVLPLCTFVRRYIERHPEYLDLVAAEDRERFDLPTT
jgi:predicted GNAT family acetyltransferase